jgi:endonuclease/exonuclease/phosphatase (EEP) superfamily protein YafD
VSKSKNKLEGILSRLFALLCLATLIGFLSFLWKPFELFTHFRVQYFLALTLVAICFIWLGNKRFFAMAAAFSMVNLCFFIPLYIPTFPEMDSRERSLRILSFNINKRNALHDEVIQYMESLKADIVFLMEVNHGMANKLRRLNDSYEHLFFEPREDNFGMAFLTRLPTIDSKINRVGGFKLPIFINNLRLGSRRLKVITAHPPPPVSMEYMENQASHWERIIELCKRSDDQVILLGDMNSTAWAPSFKYLMEYSGLKDTARGFGLQITWPVWIPPLWIPIDQCLVSPGIRVIDRKTGPNLGSDHYPLILDLLIPESQ